MNTRLKKYLRDDSASITGRLTAAQIWIFGKIFHLCVTWESLNVGEMKYVHSQFLRTMKILVGSIIFTN